MSRLRAGRSLYRLVPALSPPPITECDVTEPKNDGWTNYETWNWKRWIDCEQETREYWREQAEDVTSESATEYEWQTTEQYHIATLAERLEQNAEEMAGQWMPDQTGPFSDLLNKAIGRIEWREIAESMLEEIK